MHDPSSLPGWLAARILHIRPDAMVIDKPAGLPIDPGRAASGNPVRAAWGDPGRPPPHRTGRAARHSPGRAPSHGPAHAPSQHPGQAMARESGNAPFRDGGRLLRPDQIPAAAQGPNASLTDWLPLLQLGRRHPPQPVHRLDRDTAGCLVLGRTKPALAALGALFAGRQAEKTYWAVVAGHPGTSGGTLDAPLRKVSTREAGWRMEVHPEGQPARTAWRVLGTAADGATTWLELRPTTGRTHQLRVHCALLGCPILGDPLYGQPEHRGDRGMHLLARAIALPLDPPLDATAPIPPAMAPAFARCGAAP